MDRVPPALFQMPSIGNDSEGRVAIATAEGNIPFTVRRIFWTFGTPPHVVRGRHAHRTTHQVLVAVVGRVEVETELLDGRKDAFSLDDPTQALYLPPMCWRTIRFSQGAVLLVMASTPFEHTDYLRDLEHFRRSDQPS